MQGWFSGTSSVGNQDGRSSQRRDDRDARSQSHSHSHSRRDDRDRDRDDVKSTYSTYSTTRRSERSSPPPKVQGYFVRPHNSNESSSSIRGIFTRSGSGSGSSYYKRRPRDGYINNVVDKIRRMLRRIYAYAKRNPMKLFMLVVMPLITGGALTKVLASMGVRLPAGLASMMGGQGGRRGMSSFGGSGGLGGLAEGAGGIQNLINVAKMFM